jgi:hypothetical protein
MERGREGVERRGGGRKGEERERERGGKGERKSGTKNEEREMW